MLFSGACNKDLPLKLSDDANNARALSGNKVSSSKEKQIRKTFRKITVQGSGTSKPSKPLDEAKLNAAFKARQTQKKDIKGFRIASGAFTANDIGPYYSCHVESQNGGTIDYYLVETYSGTWTSIGENSLGYIDFYVDKPYVYEQFLVWSPQEGFTNALYFGDPYTGVSISSNMLTFTSATVLENILNRLDDAYEDHAADFFDNNTGLTDVQLDALIGTTGFDENTPLEAFEGYFAFNSYRAATEADVQAYYNGTIEADPDDNALTADDLLRTVLNPSGAVTIGSTVSFTSHSTWVGGPGECHTYMRDREKVEYTSGKWVKYVGEYHGQMLALGTHMTAKTKSLKVNGGGFKKWPAVLDSHISGTTRQSGCTDPQTFATNNKSAKTRRVFLNRKFTLLYFSYAQTPSVVSTHNIASSSYTLILPYN